MSELTEFLLARIAEDEAVARAATDGPWWYDATKWNSIDHEESVFAGARGLSATTVASTGPGNDPQSMTDADHIARHDPARVLRECAARRRIVERCSKYDPSWHSDMELAGVAEVMEDTLYDLAAIYADHPDFRPHLGLTHALHFSIVKQETPPAAEATRGVSVLRRSVRRRPPRRPRRTACWTRR